MFVTYGGESLDWSVDTTNTPVVRGAPRYGFHLLPGSDDPSEFQFPIMSCHGE